MRPFRPLWALLALPLLSGCSLKLLALRSTAALLEDGKTAFYEEPDTVLARTAMGSNLKLVEALLKSDPGNPRLLLAAAEGFCAYAYLFLEDEEPRRASAFYLRGKDYAARLLEERGVWGRLEKAAPRDVAALYWAANCVGSWVNMNRDDVEAIADLPLAEALAERARALDASFYYHGPELFLGIYHASRPKLLGGDPERARRHFEAAIGGAPDFLINRVFFAATYAVAVQDRGLFEETLRGVLEAEPELPGQALANAVAKQKAERLLGRTDELF